VDIFYHSGFGFVPTNTNFTDRTSLKLCGTLCFSLTLWYILSYLYCVCFQYVSNIVGNSNETTESVFVICG